MTLLLQFEKMSVSSLGIGGDAMTAIRTIPLAVAMMMASAAGAQPGEINYPKGSLGYDALMAADYGTAEQQLRQANGVSKRDPARLINLGMVLAHKGDKERAAIMFQRAMTADEVTIILADGREMSSYEAARLAHEKLMAERPAR